MLEKPVTKTYRGIAGNSNVLVYPSYGSPYPLHHVIYHSPTGFAWGYGGSGPADLAMSILADHLGEHPKDIAPFLGNPRCWQYHQNFTALRHFANGTLRPAGRRTPLLNFTQMTSTPGWGLRHWRNNAIAMTIGWRQLTRTPTAADWRNE